MCFKFESTSKLFLFYQDCSHKVDTNNVNSSHYTKPHSIYVLSLLFTDPVFFFKSLVFKVTQRSCLYTLVAEVKKHKQAKLNIGLCDL